MASCAEYGCPSVGKFFTGASDSHFVNFFRSVEGPDKVLKALVDVFEAIIAITEPMESVSDTARTGLENTWSVLKDTRMTLALFNIFKGVIGSIYQGTVRANNITQNLLYSDEHVNLTTKNIGEEGGRHNDVAVTRNEKICALISSIGGLIGALGYTIGFGLCRPFAFTEKRIGELGGTASSIGRAFPTVMMINHVGGVMGNAAEIAFQYLSFNRDPENKDIPEGIRPDEVSYHSKMITAITGLMQKVLELVADILYHIRVVAPIYVRVPLALSISMLSLYKVWRDTAEA